MLEKGPYIVLFGGQQLMDHEDLQNVSNDEKMIPYSLVIVLFSVCQATLFLIRKWKLRKLVSYHSVLQRYNEFLNLTFLLYPMF